MSTLHSESTVRRWHTLPLVEQLANVGSEIERSLSWASRGNPEYSQKALERGLELLGLTIGDPKYQGRRRELTRLREVLLDYFLGDNEFGSTPQSWHSYFHPYAMAVAIRKQGAQ
jgi:hypothetical protein